MSSKAATLTRLMLTVFRLNGALLEAGDALVRDTGLTSARWQVLGALAASGTARTVSQVARTMGLTRQSVQRTADDLAAGGLIEFRSNPDHARAKLMAMTAKGEDAYGQAVRRQEPWASALAEGFGEAGLTAADRLLGDLADHLNSEIQSRKRTST